jgi:hypothetical protein
VRRLGVGFTGLLLVSMLILACFPPRADAIALVQTANGQAAGATSVSATLTAVAAGNTIVAVCGATTSVTLAMTTSGFSSAINESGTPSQAIFYKAAAGGETTITCNSSGTTTRLGLHVYNYSGMETTSIVDGTPGSNTGTSTTPTTGSTTTTLASTVLVAGITIAVDTTYTTWTNSFTERNDFSNTGAAGSRGTYGGADRIVTSTGTYSTGATTGTGAWRGQIVAFKGTIGTLNVDIVNSSGVSVGSPSVGMSALSIGFDCNTSTGTLGTSSERIRVSNTTVVPQWTVAIAATSGATSLWTSGGNTFDFNDGSGAPAGCADGGDADSRPGRMTLNAAAGTSSPQSGCNNTGISLGASSSFAQGTTDSITLISASSGAGTNCYWDLTGVSVSQTIPIQQATGTYTINLTLTVTAT